MAKPAHWYRLISDEIGKRPQPISIMYVTQVLPPTDSLPFFARGNDHNTYLIKMQQTDPAKAHLGRVMVTDQIVGRVGKHLGCPVGEVAIVSVQREDFHRHPDLQKRPYVYGLSHGSCRLQNLRTTRENVGLYISDVNKPRHLSLSVLYGLMLANDHQVQYELTEPHRIFSVDHGHFFNGSVSWNIESLRSAPSVVLDGAFLTPYDFNRDTIRDEVRKLKTLTDNEIAKAVAIP